MFSKAIKDLGNQAVKRYLDDFVVTTKADFQQYLKDKDQFEQKNGTLLPTSYQKDNLEDFNLRLDIVGIGREESDKYEEQMLADRRSSKKSNNNDQDNG